MINRRNLLKKDNNIFEVKKKLGAKDSLPQCESLNPEMNPIEILKRNLEDAIRVIERLRKENEYILKEKECLMGEKYQLELCLKASSDLLKKETDKLTAEANREILRLKLISLGLGMVAIVLLILFLFK